MSTQANRLPTMANTNPSSGSPRSPFLVMGVALMFPGMGQVLNNTPLRGLIMLFFMFCLGMITYQLTTPDHSLVGRFAGGLFIYAISVMDAYKWARVRETVFAAKNSNV